MKTFKKISHQFAHRKMGAFFRYNQQGEAYLGTLTLDLMNLKQDIEKKWGVMSNAAIIQNKMEASTKALHHELGQLLRLNSEEYAQELLRIASSLGGKIDGQRVRFPDGSDANMPGKLRYQNDFLRQMVQE